MCEKKRAGMPCVQDRGFIRVASPVIKTRQTGEAAFQIGSPSSVSHPLPE